jgi:hypothetical protein
MNYLIEMLRLFCSSGDAISDSVAMMGKYMIVWSMMELCRRGVNRSILNFFYFPFPIQFFCQPHTLQFLFVSGGKEVGGLLVN